MIARTLFLGVAIALGANQQALAENAASFLKSLEGDYSGRGTAIILGDEPTKVSCKFKNAFDEGNISLKVTGECASTKGKGAVNGTITANGQKLSGTFVSTRQGVKLTQSNGTLSNGNLIISASLWDEQVGRLIKVRQSIRKTGSGINAQFFTYDNASGKYESSGTMNLRKR